MNDIIKHREQVIANIQKSFGVDIEKAFPIGTIRVWDGVEYRKVADGDWVKVDKKGAEKGAALSGVVKKMKNDKTDMSSELQLLERNLESTLKDIFEKENPELKGGDWKIKYKVKFSEYKQIFLNESKNDVYVKRIAELKGLINDIGSEISELEHEIARRAKVAREEKHGGKREIDKDDLEKNFKIDYSFADYNGRLKDENGNVVNRYLTYGDAYETLYDNKVNSNNYYLATKATFECVEQEDWIMDGDTWKKNTDPSVTFEKMKKSGKYKYTHSPKSTSEYLVDEENKCVYRLADHWGRCASCVWDISGLDFSDNNGKRRTFSERGDVLAKCDFKDFRLNESELYRTFGENPKYFEVQTKIIKSNIDKFNSLLDDEKIYFTDRAKKQLSSELKSFQRSVAFHTASISDEAKLVETLINKFNKLP